MAMRKPARNAARAIRRRQDSIGDQCADDEIQRGLRTITIAATPKTITMIAAIWEPYFSPAERRRFCNDMVVEDIDHLVSRILSRALVRFPWKVWKADTRVTLRGNRKWIS